MSPQRSQPEKVKGSRRPVPAGQRHYSEHRCARNLPVRGLGVGPPEVGAAPGAPGPSWPSLSVLSSQDPQPGTGPLKLTGSFRSSARASGGAKSSNMLSVPPVTLTGPKPRMKPAAPGAAAAVAAGTEHPKWRLPRPHHRYCRRRDPKEGESF